MNHADNGIDADSTPLLAVTNGVDKKFDIAKIPSPLSDSPVTPASPSFHPDVKIDLDYQEQESDVRHEPLPVKHVLSSPNKDRQGDHRDLSQDLQSPQFPHPNGAPNGCDIVMTSDKDSQTTAATPGISADFSMATIDSNPSTNGNGTRSYPEDSDDHQQQPPAKRARKHSDADMASVAHSATPPPASTAVLTQENLPSASAPLPPPDAESTITIAQHRFLMSTIKSLKKSKDALPFSRPVDPIALSIPHYPSIIKTPMDLSTLERKLTSSNPSKLDPNPHNPRYFSAEECISDVRLMVENSIRFNGPDHVVTIMGKRLEEYFDKMLKHLPPKAEKPKPPVVKKLATPPVPAPAPPPPPPAKKSQPARRASTSVPVIRRSEAEVATSRPKREIHPPPPKDLPYADVPKKNRKKRSKANGSSDQLKYCARIISDLHKKQHYEIAYPFYEPVDWQKLEIPSYPKLIKSPMDLSTIKKKLETGEYDTAQNFYSDFKLMIRNCFTFNPAGTPVNIAGQDLQRLFDEKWKGMPPLQHHDASEDEDEEDDSDEERRRAIALMESQIETMKNSIESLKGSKGPKEKKKKEKKEKVPVASSSKSAPKQPKGLSKKKSKKNITDDDVLSFEQKKDLSEAITNLEGARLEKVIQIIHEGVPEIRDSTEEIELEIDQLPATVLTKLYNFVLRPLRQTTQPKRNRTGKGTGTGGLKRKSMDEEKEAEKIRQLEERMALFENRNAASGPVPASARREDDSLHSSDSSSGSESSGSDSE